MNQLFPTAIDCAKSAVVELQNAQAGNKESFVRALHLLRKAVCAAQELERRAATANRYDPRER